MSITTKLKVTHAPAFFRLLKKVIVQWKIYLPTIMVGTLITIGAIIMFLPLIWTISFSFGLPQEFFKLPPPVIPSALRLDNYKAVFEKLGGFLVFFNFFKNSLIVSVIVTLGQVVTCSMAAYAFARLRFPGKNIIFILFLGSMMVPPIVTLVPTFLIVRSIGLYDSLGALIIPALASVFGVFLLRQFFETIPQDLEDAAKMDGANYFQIYWNIMLPLAGPSIATLAILTFNSSWNNFFDPLIYINSEKNMTLPLGMTFLRGQQGVMTSGVIMAAIVMCLLPVMLVFVFFQRKLVEGITMTGLKGV